MPTPIITCHAAIRGKKNSSISINHTEKFITLTVKKNQCKSISFILCTTQTNEPQTKSCTLKLKLPPIFKTPASSHVNKQKHTPKVTTCRMTRYRFEFPNFLPSELHVAQFAVGCLD